VKKYHPFARTAMRVISLVLPIENIQMDFQC